MLNEQSFNANKERGRCLQLDGGKIDVESSVGSKEHNSDGRIISVIITRWKHFAEPCMVNMFARESTVSLTAAFNGVNKTKNTAQRCVTACLPVIAFCDIRESNDHPQKASVCDFEYACVRAPCQHTVTSHLRWQLHKTGDNKQLESSLLVQSGPN